MFEKLFSFEEKLKRNLSRKMKVLNTIELSKSYLIFNYRYFKKEHPESVVCPVIKCNAYGHGLIEIAKILDNEKPVYFVVDSFYESLQLRKAGVKTPRLIIGYTLPENFKHMSFKSDAITVMDKESVEALGALKKHIKVHLKVDTGMHRQGVPYEKALELIKLIKTYKKLHLEGVCTHLADADNPKDDKFTKIQVKNFKKVIADAKKAGITFKYKHISATPGAGIIHDKEFNMMRVGIGLYGSSPHTKNVKPIMTFKSTIIAIKELKEGDCVSYGCTFAADKDMKIGVIPAGYYEGVDRGLSNKGFIYYKNKPCKILGRVCMNLTMIDLTGVKNVRKFDTVDVIGSNISAKNSAEWIAKTCGTIPYVIWTHVAPTIRRVVK